MAKVNIGEFIRQVRQEVSKVSWASRKETMVSTGMVIVVVSIASLFFIAVDMLIFHGVQAILNIGS